MAGEYWWEGRGQPHERLGATFDSLQGNHRTRKELLARYERVYANITFDTVAETGSMERSLGGAPVRLNVTRSAIDTLVSKVAKNQVDITYLTEGGNHSDQRRARKLKQFVSGVNHAANGRERLLAVVRDAAIYGTGALLPHRFGGQRIGIDRVCPEELLVDPAEALYGEPRTLYRVRYVDRQRLAALFPNARRAIMEAERYGGEDHVEHGGLSISDTVSLVSARVIADPIRVVEAWRLPDDDEAEEPNGRYACTIAGATLRTSEYYCPHFPFVFLHWSPPLRGFWGTGLVEELRPIQSEIDKLTQRIQAALHLLGVPWVLNPNSSGIKVSTFANQTALILNYDGTIPPSVSTHGSVAPDLFSHLDRLYARAYEIAGISQLSAGGVKPAGLEHAVAMREYQDIESERFQAFGRRVEQAAIELAAREIDLAKEIDRDTPGGFVMRGVAGKELVKLKWSEVELDRDAFVMKAFPINYLGSTPAGRLNKVLELAQAEIFDRTTALSLLDFPDVDAEVSEQTAARENIKYIIALIEDQGKYVGPEPYMDLSGGLRRVQNAYLRGMTHGLEERKLELFRRWLDEADAMLTSANQPQLNAAVGTEAGPPEQATAGASPTGDTGQAALDQGAPPPLPV